MITAMRMISELITLFGVDKFEVNHSHLMNSSKFLPIFLLTE